MRLGPPTGTSRWWLRCCSPAANRSGSLACGREKMLPVVRVQELDCCELGMIRFEGPYNKIFLCFSFPGRPDLGLPAGCQDLTRLKTTISCMAHPSKHTPRQLSSGTSMKITPLCGAHPYFLGRGSRSSRVRIADISGNLESRGYSETD